MRRRLVRICVFLLLGAIVNVAVAWLSQREQYRSPNPGHSFVGIVLPTLVMGWPLRVFEKVHEGRATVNWPGFAINTVFYAVILWGLFAGPFVVRRWRRIRRGLCPKCAYDLRGTRANICPECGAAAASSEGAAVA